MLNGMHNAYKLKKDFCKFKFFRDYEIPLSLMFKGWRGYCVRLLCMNLYPKLLSLYKFIFLYYKFTYISVSCKYKPAKKIFVR